MAILKTAAPKFLQQWVRPINPPRSPGTWAEYIIPSASPAPSCLCVGSDQSSIWVGLDNAAVHLPSPIFPSAPDPPASALTNALSPTNNITTFNNWLAGWATWPVNTLGEKVGLLRGGNFLVGATGTVTVNGTNVRIQNYPGEIPIYKGPQFRLYGSNSKIDGIRFDQSNIAGKDIDVSGDGQGIYRCWLTNNNTGIKVLLGTPTSTESGGQISGAGAVTNFEGAYNYFYNVGRPNGTGGNTNYLDHCWYISHASNGSLHDNYYYNVPGGYCHQFYGGYVGCVIDNFDVYNNRAHDAYHAVIWTSVTEVPTNIHIHDIMVRSTIASPGPAQVLEYGTDTSTLPSGNTLNKVAYTITAGTAIRTGSGLTVTNTSVTNPAFVSPSTGNFIASTAAQTFLGVVDPGAYESLAEVQLDGSMIIHPTPTGGVISGIINGPDGNIWYTEFTTNKLSTIDVTTGAVTQYALTAGAAPSGLCIGADGNIWFTETGNNGRISRFNIGTHVITRFAPTTTAGYPTGPALGYDNRVWFALRDGSKVAAVTTAGVITEYSTGLTAGSAPLNFSRGSDSNMWFTESTGNRIAKITSTGTITEFPIPTSTSSPSGITSGPDSNLWVAENAGNKLAAFDPVQSAIGEVTIPTAATGPTAIILGPDDLLWFCENDAGKLGNYATGTPPLTPPQTPGFRVGRGPMLSSTSWIESPRPNTVTNNPNTATIINGTSGSKSLSDIVSLYTESVWTGAFSPIPYILPASQPFQPVALINGAGEMVFQTASKAKVMQGAGAPIPGGFSPQPSTDAPACFYLPDYQIFDSISGTTLVGGLWDFWRLQFAGFYWDNYTGTHAVGALDPRTQNSPLTGKPYKWEAQSYGRMLGMTVNDVGHYLNRGSATANLNTYESSVWGASAASLPLAPLMILEEDIINWLGSGIIPPHALGMAVKGSGVATAAQSYANTNFVWPAQHTDGKDPNALIYEGMRFYLPRSVTISNSLHPLAQMIAHQAQEYCIVIWDQTGSGVAFRAEAAITKYFNGTPQGSILSGFPWSSLKVASSTSTDGNIWA